MAGFDPEGHRLVVLETGRTGGSAHVLADGTRTERGTPEYLRDVARAVRQAVTLTTEGLADQRASRAG